MLKEKTRAVVQSLLKINDSVIFTYPTICVRSGKSTFAFFDCSKHGEEPFPEFGTFHTSEMLSLVNLIPDAEVSIEDRQMLIQNSKNKIKYLTSKLLMLEETSRQDPELLIRMRANKKLLDFELSQKEIDSAIKISDLLKGLENFVISGKDNVLSIEVKGDEKSTNSYSIEVQGKCEEDIEFIIDIKSIKNLPSGDYSISLHQNAKGTIVAIFTHKTIDGLAIVLTGKLSK